MPISWHVFEKARVDHIEQSEFLDFVRLNVLGWYWVLKQFTQNGVGQWRNFINIASSFRLRFHAFMHVSFRYQIWFAQLLTKFTKKETSFYFVEHSLFIFIFLRSFIFWLFKEFFLIGVTNSPFLGDYLDQHQSLWVSYFSRFLMILNLKIYKHLAYRKPI